MKISCLPLHKFLRLADSSREPEGRCASNSLCRAVPNEDERAGLVMSLGRSPNFVLVQLTKPFFPNTVTVHWWPWIQISHLHKTVHSSFLRVTWTWISDFKFIYLNEWYINFTINFSNVYVGNIYVPFLGDNTYIVTSQDSYVHIYFRFLSLRMGNLIYKLLSNFHIILENVGPSDLPVQTHFKM